MKRLLPIVAVAAIAAFLLVPAVGDAHYKPTCRHMTFYTTWVDGFGYTWKIVLVSWYGDPEAKHDHGHNHYRRTPSNPTWTYNHHFITTNCSGH